MADKSNCFSVIWKIENICFSNNIDLRSPAFKTKSGDGTAWWRLHFCPRLDLKFYLESLIKGTTYEYCEMSLLSSSVGEIPLHNNNDYELRIGTNGMTFIYRHVVIPQDTLFICCKMLQQTLVPIEIMLQTALHKVDLVWCIGRFNFSDLKHRKFHQQNDLQFTMSLVKNKNCSYQMILEELESQKGNPYFVNCRLFIQDGQGRVWDKKYDYMSIRPFWDIEIYEKYNNGMKGLFYTPSNSDVFQLVFKLDAIIVVQMTSSDKLPGHSTLKDIQNPTLSSNSKRLGAESYSEAVLKSSNTNRTATSSEEVLESSITIHAANCYEAVLESSNSNHAANSSEEVLESSKTSHAANSSEADLKSPTSIFEDLLLMYREGSYSDVTLKAKDKEFSVHKNILAARSSAFRDIFQKYSFTDGHPVSLTIEDVDSKTLDRMLVFLYSDFIETLQWTDASMLYCAADKYAVRPLKQKCVDILIAGLTINNACEALVLADQHKDEQLMKFVVDFICDHDKIANSVEWLNMEEANPRLAAKVLREVFVKK